MKKAANAVLGAFEDSVTTGGDYPFDFPNGIMQKQTGTNICVNTNINQLDGVFLTEKTITSKEDCLNKCIEDLSLFWDFIAINESEDICCMYITNTGVGFNQCSGSTGKIQSSGSLYDSYFIISDPTIYAISTKRGSTKPI